MVCAALFGGWLLPLLASINQGLGSYGAVQAFGHTIYSIGSPMKRMLKISSGNQGLGSRD